MSSWKENLNLLFTEKEILEDTNFQELYLELKKIFEKNGWDKND
ncbi:MAG: hypothetical protein ACOX1V_02055 [Candidatus Iainarchaeum sp.]